MIITFFALTFAWIAIHLVTLFWVLLGLTLALCALVLIAIKAAGRLIRKPNGMVP